MPGVLLEMENGDANGRTDRDGPAAAVAANGVVGGGGAPSMGKGRASTDPNRMNDLPDDVVHITQGFIPLSAFLTRLAQLTHNSLQDKMVELAKMPIPASAVNGTPSNLTSSAPDDTSAENLRKKAALLHFTQDMHAKWVKALVIMEWSRKSEMVSKLIDLKFHIDQQRILYDMALDSMVNVKRDLSFARMPSPDLKTALQILSTGSAPWIPDVCRALCQLDEMDIANKTQHQYIEPPPLTPDEQLRWINDLNTLLSLRLNLEDYDKIPHQFRDYEIGSGRVTFKVPGEFEVELTIADEDFEKQFWFIDFRYTFRPAAASLSDGLRNYLENYVNDALAREGLAGCYQFLHELVLTAKINELKRQAFQLSKTSWDGTLVIEPLNRALAIQYWSSRPSAGKSWVLVAINSGKKNGKADGKSTSQLVAKWYRDNKEVKDVKLALDVDNLSAESLLKEVIGRHISYILQSIRDKLLEAPRFKNREAAMRLRLSAEDPGACMLTTQVGHADKTTLLVEPTTGMFAVKPQSKFSIQYEHQLNSGKNTADDSVTCLENVRCAMMEDELHRRGSAAGWESQKSPLSAEETKSITKSRDWTRTIWMRRQGWGQTWYIAIFLGLAGDEWWLVEANRNDLGRAIKFQARVSLSKGHPDLSDSFWSNLTIFTTGIIAQAVDMRELHRLHIKSRSNDSIDLSLPQQIRLPSIQVALSAMFPSMVYDGDRKSGGRQPWANNMVTIRFKGIESNNDTLDCLSEAVLRVRKPSKFAALKGTVDRNLSYNATLGEFCLHIQHAIGEPVLVTLKSRIMAIDRFVNFLEAMDRAKGSIIGELVTLKEIRFLYVARSDGKQWRITLNLSRDEIAIDIDRGNPHLRVVDLMQQLVNGEGGIGALMGWLPASLRALDAINSIETRWEDLQSKRVGQVEFAMKTLSWLSVMYTVVSGGTTKRVVLQVQAKMRRGEPWWHVWRSDVGAKTVPEDAYNTALNAVWEKRGDGWMGLTTGAAARSEGGIVEMLLAVDDAIRSVLVDDASTAGTQSSNPSFTQPTTQSQNSGKDVVILD